jgi:nucleoside-diphosphate-sugar epimerase
VKIFLAGATGFIGSHFLKHSLAAGHSVTCSVRSPKQADAIRAWGASPWEGDLQNQDELSLALVGMDVLIHAAGCRDLTAPADLLLQSNVRLTQALVGAAGTANVAQFIYISAASVVMSKPTALFNVTESAPITLQHFLPYTRSKAIAEASVLAAPQTAMRVVVLRPSFVWGKGDSIDTEIGPASNRGQFGWFSQGHYPFSTCSIANLCDALQRAMQHTQSGGIFNISDRESVDFRVFMTRRLEVSGFQVPTLSVPRKLAWWLGAFTETGWTYLPMPGKPPIVREMVRLMGFPFTVSIERAERDLGYLGSHSIEAGMSNIASVQERQQGSTQQ